MITAEKVRKFLSTPSIQHKLAKLGERDEATGKAYIHEVLAEYCGEKEKKLKYQPYFLILNSLPKKLNTDKETLIKEVFSQPFYQKAIANVARSVGEYGLHLPQVFSAPILVVWNFTNACNLFCKHCYQDAHHALPDELTLEERLNIIDQLNYNDVSSLAISGGEPLMSPHFWPVAEYAHEKGIHLSVATNGTLITKEVAARLKEVGVDYVEISIDSIDPQTHDEFRGGTGYWERSMAGIRNCVEIDGLSVGMATTVTRYNFAELQSIIDLAKETRVNSFYAFNFIPAGRGKAMIDQDLPPAMREEMMGILYENFVNNDISTFSTCTQYGRYCQQQSDDDMVINSHYSFAKGKHAKILADYIGGCGAGRLYCAIQPNGKVTPCVFMSLVEGDLRKNTLKEIWDSSPIMKDLRDRAGLKEGCVSCENRSMCGGCRARAYGYFQDYMGPDPGCINNQAAWDQLLAQEEMAK